jgi:hypothetical protein
VLKAFSENKIRRTSSNTISTTLQLSNQGNLALDYKDLKVRYWFTSEGNQQLNFYLDYTSLGMYKVMGSFVKLPSPQAGADTYLEFRFAQELGKLYPLTSIDNIQFRIAKSDWSNFILNNDHSYMAAAPIAENIRITVYWKDQLIYGTEPAGSATARMASNAYQQEESALSVVVLGNPVRGREVKLEVRGAQGQALQLEITDLAGRVMVQQNIVEADLLELPCLILPEQTKGMLLLRVSTASQMKLVKVFKIE